MEKEMTERKTNKLGERPIFSLLLSMGIPGLLGNMTTYLYKTVDQIYVGNFVGHNALGGISVLNPFNNVVIALSLFITVGGAALLSVAVGSKNYDKANKLFTNVIIQAIVMALIVTVIFAAAPEFWVRLFGAKEGTEIFDYAVSYLRIIAFGQVFNLLNLGLAAIIRTEGAATYSMIANMIGAVVNVGLNTIFIVVLHLGVQGAAYGTVGSQLVGALFSAAYFFRGKSNLKWLGLKVINIKQMFYVAKMGMAPSIFQVLSFITNILLNKSLQHYGDLDPVYSVIGGGELCISAMAVATTIENLIISTSSGINQAAAPIVSFNYGAKKYQRVWKTTLVSQAIAFSMAAAVYLAMQLAPEQLIDIFSKNDKELMTFGLEAIRIAKIFALFSGYQMLVSMFFSAICKPEVATLVSLSRHGIFLIPALIILPQIYGLQGVLYANAVSDGCSLILVSILYIKEIIYFKGCEDEEIYDDRSFIKRAFDHFIGTKKMIEQEGGVHNEC